MFLHNTHECEDQSMCGSICRFCCLNPKNDLKMWMRKANWSSVVESRYVTQVMCLQCKYEPWTWSISFYWHFKDESSCHAICSQACWWGLGPVSQSTCTHSFAPHSPSAQTHCCCVAPPSPPQFHHLQRSGLISPETCSSSRPPGTQPLFLLHHHPQWCPSLLLTASPHPLNVSYSVKIS